MSVLPETATHKTGRRPPRYAAVGAALLAALFVAVFVRGSGFSPGEEIYVDGLEDISVSPEDAAYPRSDSLRVEGRPGAIYVYLAVEGAPSVQNLEVRVERSERRSLLASFFARGDDLQVRDGEQERLGVSGAGASGVIKFAVRTESGEPLPAGNYTVSVYLSDAPAARKYFVVAD